MIESFKKQIKNYILPQFPWVKGFDVDTPWEDDGIIHVVVGYFPEVSEDNTFVVTEDFNRIEEMTKSVFNMLDDGNYTLSNIYFSSQEII
jgi:hypothetical protein